jgi:hypothetical protein
MDEKKTTINQYLDRNFKLWLTHVELAAKYGWNKYTSMENFEDYGFKDANSYPWACMTKSNELTTGL